MLGRFPQEVVIQILRFLPLDELLRVMPFVASQYRGICYDSYLLWGTAFHQVSQDLSPNQIALRHSILDLKSYLKEVLKTNPQQRIIEEIRYYTSQDFLSVFTNLQIASETSLQISEWIETLQKLQNASRIESIVQSNILLEKINNQLSIVQLELHQNQTPLILIGLTRLTTIFLSKAAARNLTGLNISKTKITTIPSEISKLAACLLYINIKGLELPTLPAEFGQLRNLEAIELAGAQFLLNFQNPLPSALEDLKDSVKDEFTMRGVKFGKAPSFNIADSPLMRELQRAKAGPNGKKPSSDRFKTAPLRGRICS